MRLPAYVSIFSTVALVSAALVHSDDVSAQVVLRCGGPNGVHTVNTAGFTINGAGEVVFSESSIACNVEQEGLPNALVLSITQPLEGHSINVSAQAQAVTFSAHLDNYTQGVDSCSVQVIPPNGTAWPAVALSPVNEVATTQLQFAQNAQAGSYTLRLSCTRQSNGQQVIVNPVNRSMTVISTQEPTACQSFPIPAVFNPVIQQNFTNAYNGDPDGLPIAGSGGFGVQPNVTTVWRYWDMDNVFSNNALTKSTLRVWKFRPTSATKAGPLKGNMGASANIALSISECPGKFVDLPTKCTASSGSIYWSTNPADSATQFCKLDPTKDYYISAAQFDLSHLLSTGQYRSLYNVCAGTNCTSQNLYQVQNKKL